MVKVAVIGAAGGIGQPLSLLLKLNPKIDELSLYDVVPLVAGVAADVSHINTPAQVRTRLRSVRSQPDIFCLFSIAPAS